MRAAILSIGDELALGQNIDTNSAWLAARLAERSILVDEHRTVADDRAAIAAAVAALAASHDLLIITGGLGPTEDDLTREALGDALAPGEQPLLDETALRDIIARFDRRGVPMPDINRKQAQRPSSMRCLPNPHGTAPGLAGTHRGSRIFALPGPPFEMQPMFTNHVLPELPAADPRRAVRTLSIHEFGMGESDAAQRLGDLMRRDREPLVGITVSGAIVSARIRAVGASEDEIERLASRIERAWQPYVFGRDADTLAAAVGALLRQDSRTLATAESCTGGWLGQMIVDVPGSSDYYRGGWVTYSNDMKQSQLRVPPQTLERCGAVSRETAEAMARGALELSGAHEALAITGIAGPARDDQPTEKPVGTVFIALARRHASTIESHVRRFQFPGDRSMIRLRAAQAALQMLRFAHIGRNDAPLLWETPSGEVGEPAGGLASPPDVTPNPVAAYLALGSNLGDREALIRSALAALARTPGVTLLAVSEIIETAPVGQPGQGPYLNAVAAISTTLTPRQLLETCLKIEAAHGRDRSQSQRWAARLLDIDILLFDSQIVVEQGLRIPHPHMLERPFVLLPLLQIAPDLVHPETGRRIQSHHDRLQQEGPERLHQEWGGSCLSP